MQSITDPSYIVVYKFGAARRFRIENIEDPGLVYDAVLKPGSAVFMSTSANKKFKHSVPFGEAEASGSLVGRCISTCLSRTEADVMIAKAGKKKAATDPTSYPGSPASVGSLGLTSLSVCNTPAAPEDD